MRSSASHPTQYVLAVFAAASYPAAAAAQRTAEAFRRLARDPFLGAIRGT